MSQRILILTAGFGEGHNAAARALAEAFDTSGGPGTARTVDALALASPRLNALSRRGYLELINRAPRLWSAFYGWVDRSRFFPHSLALLQREIRLLARVIAAEQPVAICSTFPLYAVLLARLPRAARGFAPHFNIVTDSISLNSLWWQAGSDGWFLPNADSAAVLATAGIPTNRLHVHGFPVAPFFAAHTGKLHPPALNEGTPPRVLYIINSSTRSATQIAHRLLAEPDWEITCAVGRNETLRRDLEQRAAGRKPATQILGWTDQIPRLLMTHHAVVSKAGGATTQEAIAARCPMLVNQIIPGQEEGNYELLRRHGIGALAETPDAVITELRRAFRDNGAVWRQWRAALAQLSRPTAAREIADEVLRWSAGRPTRDTQPPRSPESIPLPTGA